MYENHQYSGKLESFMQIPKLCFKFFNENYPYKSRTYLETGADCAEDFDSRMEALRLRFLTSSARLALASFWR